MANSPSSRKRIRRNARRAVVNGARLGRVRSFIRKVKSAIASGDAEEARKAFRAAEPEIARSAQRGVMHRKTAGRTLSRLAQKVKALAG